MRWSDAAGDYSHAFSQVMVSDLIELNALTRSLTEGIVLSARSVRLVKPGAQVRPAQLRNARNGDYFIGEPDTVTTIQGGKTQDLITMIQQIQSLEQRIYRICAMPISVQRSGERVPAVEFQTLATSLDAASTGFYSTFASEVQPRIVTRLMHLLVMKGLLDPQYISDDEGNEILDVTPVTGLQALGRESEVGRLLRFAQSGTELVGPDVFAQHVDMTELMSRLGTGMGVNTDGLIVSKEELEAQAQAQAQAEQEAQAQAEQAKLQQTLIQSPAMGQAVKNAGQSAENTTSPEQLSA